jgi:hypothetical protein
MVLHLPVHAPAQAAHALLQPGINRHFFCLLVFLHELFKGEALHAAADSTGTLAVTRLQMVEGE